MVKNPSVLRIWDTGVGSRRQLKDLKIEKLADASGIQITGTDGNWVAVAPDGSPLILRDVSLNEIYSLDFDAP
jgi:hypothetical protein